MLFRSHTHTPQPAPAAHPYPRSVVLHSPASLLPPPSRTSWPELPTARRAAAPCAPPPIPHRCCPPRSKAGDLASLSCSLCQPPKLVARRPPAPSRDPQSSYCDASTSCSSMDYCHPPRHQEHDWSSPVAPALPPTSSTLKTPTHPIRWWSKHGGKKDSHPAVAQALLPAGGHLHVSSIWALPCSCNPLSPAAAAVPCLALSVRTAQAIHCLHTRPFDDATLKQITLTSTKPFTSATKGVAISFC